MSTGTPKESSHTSRSTASKVEQTEEVKESNDSSHVMYSNEAMEMLQMCFSEQELTGNEQEKMEYGGVESIKVANTLNTPSTSAEVKRTQTQNEREILSSSSSSSSSVTIYKPGIDANKFIEEKQRSGVSMDVLRDDINTYVNSLQTKIERYVNDDLYSSFVHVSGKFVGIPEELQNIHAPIKRLVNEVEGISDTLTRLGNTLQLKLHEADEAQNKRNFLTHYTEFLLVYSRLYEMNNVVNSNSKNNFKESIGQNELSDNIKASFKCEAVETLQQKDQHDNFLESLQLANKALVQKNILCPEHLNTLQQMMLTIARLQTLRSELLLCGNNVKELETECAEVSRYLHSAEEVVLHQFQHTFSWLCIVAFVLNDVGAKENNNNNNNNKYTELDGNNKLFYIHEKEQQLQQQQQQQQLQQQCQQKIKMQRCDWRKHFELMESIHELVRVCRVTCGASAIKDAFCTHVLKPYFTEKYFGNQRNVNASEAANNSNKTNSTTLALTILRKMQHDLQFIILPLISVIATNETSSVHYTELSFSMFTREVIWPTIADLLLSRLPSLFDIVDVDGFQQKYIAAHALQMILINNQETSGYTETSNNNLIESKSVFVPMNNTKANLGNNSELKEQNASLTRAEEEWEEKWNVEIYATVRTSEMHRRVMAALDHIGQLSSKTNIIQRETEDNTVPFILHCTSVLIAQTEELFSPRVFLAVCTPFFVREVVLCVVKVTQTMEKHYNDNESNSEFVVHNTSNSVNNDNTITGSNTTNNASNKNRSENNNNNNNNNSESNRINVKQSRLYFALCSIRDLISLDHYLDYHLVHLIKNSLLHEMTLLTENECNKIAEGERKLSAHVEENKYSDENTTMTNEITRSIAAITAVVSHIRHACCHKYRLKFENYAIKSVVDDCTVVLQNIKSVRSAYTHTKKPLPTSASWYVSGVVTPVIELTHLCQRCLFDATEMSHVISTTVDRVIEEFLTIAQETLILAKRTEESWEKLRRRKEALTANDNNIANLASTTNNNDTSMNKNNKINNVAQRVTDASASDRDKMIIQLYLDAEAILSSLAHVTEYAVPSTHVRERLQNLLRRAEWLRGADIDEPIDVSDLEERAK